MLRPGLPLGVVFPLDRHFLPRLLYAFMFGNCTNWNITNRSVQIAILRARVQSECKERTVTVHGSHRYAIGLSDNCLFAPSVECLVSAQVWGCLQISVSGHASLIMEGVPVFVGKVNHIARRVTSWYPA